MLTPRSCISPLQLCHASQSLGLRMVGRLHAHSSFLHQSSAALSCLAVAGAEDGREAACSLLVPASVLCSFVMPRSRWG